MKFNCLEDLINYIMNDIMNDEYEKYLKISFGKEEILIFVFESEIPITISFHNIYYEEDDSLKSKKEIVAEVCAELLRTDIGKGCLQQLDNICTILEENSHIFEKLLKQI